MTLLKKPFILIVDDEPEIILIIESLLSKYDVKVITSTNGDDAAYKANNQEFCMIFLDFNLPKADGAEVLAKIRKPKSVNKDTPVVIISAFLNPDNLKKLLPLKVDTCLTKPIENSRFFSVVNKYLKPSLTTPPQSHEI